MKGALTSQDLLSDFLLYWEMSQRPYTTGNQAGVRQGQTKQRQGPFTEFRFAYQDYNL